MTSRVYPVTNESINAAIAGLRPQAHDKILAICGSGDMPLALLAHADEIVAIDRSLRQVEYAQSRLDLVARNDLRVFRTPRGLIDLERKYLPERNEYFSEERLGRLRLRLPSLTIEHADLLTFLQNRERSFDKIYLSNIFNFVGTEKAPLLVERIAAALRPGGWCYHADDLRSYGCGLELNETLTSDARTKMRWVWKPSVYERRN